MNAKLTLYRELIIVENRNCVFFCSFKIFSKISFGEIYRGKMYISSEINWNDARREFSVSKLRHFLSLKYI